MNERERERDKERKMDGDHEIYVSRVKIFMCKLMTEWLEGQFNAYQLNEKNYGFKEIIVHLESRVIIFIMSEVFLACESFSFSFSHDSCFCFTF